MNRADAGAVRIAAMESNGQIDPFGPGVDSYSRMKVVLDNALKCRSILDWYKQLGDAWSMCDNIWRYARELRPYLIGATRAELDAMMTPEELAALSAMPARIEIWRGCYAINRNGLSWSLDRAVAERFPTLTRYHRPSDSPILRRARVGRDRAVLKFDRNEAEVIVPRVYRATEEPITPHRNPAPQRS